MVLHDSNDRSVVDMSVVDRYSFMCPAMTVKSIRIVCIDGKIS